MPDVDYVPPSIPEDSYLWKHRAKLVICEDNDAVIIMCKKGRWTTMRHLLRVHRVDLDTLWERLRADPSISMRYVNTKQQLADILTKGSFTKMEWDRLVDLLQIRPSFKRTKQDRDAQAKISQGDDFKVFDESVPDAANIPKTHPNHKNHKNKKRGKQTRAQEVGGVNSY